MNIKFLLSFLSLFILTADLSASYNTDEQAFLTSFLKHYEFGPEGRYVHEYHPFVLQKTRQSFLDLEKSLQENKLQVGGRMIILGYEEQGVPTYYTDFMMPKIDDEAMVKGKSGWSLKLHNRFGFMTGFLLKDVNRLAEIYKFGDKKVFEHINPEQLLIFNDRATVFQEHAFGQALPLIMRNKAILNKLIMNGNTSAVLRSLVPFWEILYSGALKVGNSQIAGTQDILFSIEYGKYVLSSAVPVDRCFIGPDITYPIEIFAKQQKDVTRNSQAFVKKFVPNLKPVNNEPTVYIFCSFVDGVGKSTMLGNIKNWMRHGSNVNLYDHVDNSSSQLAELFKFKEHVFIADLPAQLSHFTYKPDGVVYVDVLTTLSSEQYRKLDEYITSQKSSLCSQYKKDLEAVRIAMAQEGPHIPSMLHNPQKHFLRNLILLKKDQENTWIPCSFNNEEYLFNEANKGEYRTLLPIGKAKSEGLKNIEADQMLFSDGVRLPLPYDFFVDNLVTRLKAEGIKKVVFVDFLSMYPRSSRENIRVNYLLQQLGLLDRQFDTKTSMYRNFTSGGELLYCLLKGPIYEKIVHSLELEAQVRWHLYSMIQNRTENTLNGYSEAELTQQLRSQITATQTNPQGIYEDFKKNLHTKLTYEKRQLTELYGKAKSFVNVQLFSMRDAYEFYTALQQCITQDLDSPILEGMWEKLGSLPYSEDLEHCDQGFCDNIELTSSMNKRVQVIYKIHEECRADSILAPFLRLARASWLTAIFCFFGGTSGNSKPFSIKEPMFPHIPLHLIPGNDGYWYLVQESFPEINDTPEEQPVFTKIFARICNMPAQKKVEYRFVDNIPYIITPHHVATNLGIFDYDCSLVSQKTSYSESAMTKLVRSLQKDSSVNIVTPLIDAYNALIHSSSWASEQRTVMTKIQKRIFATPDEPNGLFTLLYPNRFEPSSETQSSKRGQPTRSYTATLPIHRSIKKILIGSPWQEDIIRMALRMWLTLDMIIKDPEGDLIVRTLNTKDISTSVVLLEAFIMPKYFGLCFEHDLFPDYENIELFPSNDYWDHLVPL